VTWEDELHLVPTRNRALLASCVGRRIVRLVHYAEESNDELLENKAYAARQVTRTQLFSMANGPLLVELDDGTKLCVASSEELVSVTVEVADEPELDREWEFRIDATDAEHSEPRFTAIMGKRIAAVRVLQEMVPPSERGKIVDRPREVGLVFDLDGGSSVVFSHLLVAAPNDFAVITDEDLRKTTVQHTEVLRLP
jgi:hypothetical protein